MDRANSVPMAVTFIIVVALTIGVILSIKFVVEYDSKKYQEATINEIGKLPNFRISMNGRYYIAVTKVSYASQEFIKNIPLSIEMSDEDGNKMKGCSYSKITGEATKIKDIEKGDVLLDGDSCIVIATADFSGGNKYKKVGHIENMEDFPEGTYNVVFSKD